MNHLNFNRSAMTRYCCITYKCRLNVVKMAVFPIEYPLPAEVHVVIGQIIFLI